MMKQKVTIAVSEKSRSKYSLAIIILSLTILLILIFFIRMIFANTVKVATPGKPHQNCKIAGCNSELCVDKNSEDIASVCMYSPEYACLKLDICTIHKNGKCGWSNTTAYQQCIRTLPSPASNDIPVM